MPGRFGRWMLTCGRLVLLAVAPPLGQQRALAAATARPHMIRIASLVMASD